MLLNNEQKRRYIDFWERNKTDRACLFIESWDGAKRYPAAESLKQKWEDVDYRTKLALYNSEHTRYYAEGFPWYFTDFGPGSLAACIGGSFSYAPTTVWFENKPYFVEKWEGRPTPALNRDSEMYNLVERLTQGLLLHKDKFMTSICDIGGTFDILASLRGTENLLYDMYDHPDEVKSLLADVAPLWKQYFLEYSDRLIKEQGAMTSWMPIWSDKSYFPLQNDYSAMISPEMFKEFVLPDLQSQTEFMDRSVYHLDGIGELPHLDLLLSLPRLSAIQWIPGDINPVNTDPCWFEMLRRIQAAGKGIVLLGAPASGLENLFKNVSQRGLYISTYVRDEKDANDIIEMAKKLNF